MKARLASDCGPHSQLLAEQPVRLEQRLTRAREAVTTRKTEVRSLEVVPGTQQFLNISVPQGWERAVTD